MTIHIPAHLEKLEVVSQLKKLLIEYSKLDETSGSDNFESYLYERSLDPVKRFLGLCISEENLGTVDYDALITYYTDKLFSFRGSNAVFDILDLVRGLLGISVLDVTYTIHTLKVNFGEVETSDMNLFVNSAYEFFSALLYYQDYLDYLDTLRLTLTVEAKMIISDGVYTFTEYPISEVDVCPENYINEK